MEDKGMVQPPKLMDVLHRHNFHFQKKYGQNFLNNSAILEQIADGANLDPEDCVLEIGPGAGTLTRVLARRVARVVAIEIDRSLVPVLAEMLAGCKNVDLLVGDVCKMDLAQVLPPLAQGRRVKMVANLPYYITTPLVMDVLEKYAFIQSLTIMIQKEVAQRMQAGPGTKSYGALSLAVQYFSTAAIVAKVPAGAFIPQPKVDSAVIRLERRPAPPVEVEDKELLFALIRAGFNQRRKTLPNALACLEGLSMSKEDWAALLEELGYGSQVRGEALDLSQFARLAQGALEWQRQRQGGLCGV